MFFLLHILLMGSAVLGFIAGISIAVFFRNNKNWLKFHKRLNLFSLAATVAGIMMAFIYVTNSNGQHLNGFHQMMGLAALIVASITMLVGFYQFKARNKSATRAVHRWLGRISLLSFLAVITLGLMLINII